MSWYKTGDDGREQVNTEQQQQQEKFDAPSRFWMPPNTDKDIICLDSEGLIK